MKSFILKTVGAIVSVCLAVSSLCYGVTEQEVQRCYDSSLHVLSPRIPNEITLLAKKEFQDGAYSFLSHRKQYDYPLNEKRVLHLGQGIAAYNAATDAWMEDYQFPIWENDSIEGMITVWKKDGIWETSSKYDNNRYNSYRLSTDLQHPLVLSYFVESPSASTFLKRADQLHWIYGTNRYQDSQIDIYFEYQVNEKYNAMADRMKTSLEKQIKEGQAHVFELSSKNAIDERIYEKENINSSKEASITLNQRGNNLFAPLKNEDENLSFVLESESRSYNEELFWPDEKFVTFQQIEKVAKEGGYPDIPHKRNGKTIYYKIYSASSVLQVSGYMHPNAIAYKIMCTQKDEIVAAWIEILTYQPSNDSEARDIIERQTLYEDYFVIGFNNNKIFPVNATKSQIQNYLQKEYRRAGYVALSSAEKKSAQSIHGYYAINTQESINEFLVSYFNEHGWSFPESMKFKTVLGSPFTSMENKQAHLASILSGSATFVADYSDGVTIARYLDTKTQTRVDDIFPVGIPHKARSAPAQNFPYEAQFYAEVKFKSKTTDISYWIDYFYAVGSGERYSWLLITPGIPNKTTNQYERFFYPVTVKPTEIKVDMQRYYKENGV